MALTQIVPTDQKVTLINNLYKVQEFYEEHEPNITYSVTEILACKRGQEGIFYDYLD